MSFPSSHLFDTVKLNLTQISNLLSIYQIQTLRMCLLKKWLLKEVDILLFSFTIQSPSPGQSPHFHNAVSDLVFIQHFTSALQNLMTSHYISSPLPFPPTTGQAFLTGYLVIWHPESVEVQMLESYEDISSSNVNTNTWFRTLN